MRKKSLLIILSLVLVSGLIFGSCAEPAPAPAPAPEKPAPAPAPQPETIDLGFVHIWPATHFTATNQFPRYFKMVEEATGGKYILNIEYYPVGTLLGGAEAYDGVVKGIAESGTSSFGYTPGRFPVTLTMNQSGIAPPKDCQAAGLAEWDFYNKYKPAELDDVKILCIYPTGPGWIHSHVPITTVDQMKGMKIRVTGSGVLGVQAVGGEPIAMPMGDVYQAAQKGTIEALVSPLETLEGWKHAEVFDYSTFVPYFYSEFFWLAMNWDKWNSLPKDLQAAFDAVAPDAVKDASEIWQDNMKHGMDFASASPGGHEFIYFSDDEVAKLKEMLKPVRSQYVGELNSKGFPGEEIVTAASEIMEKYN